MNKNIIKLQRAKAVREGVSFVGHRWDCDLLSLLSMRLYTDVANEEYSLQSPQEEPEPEPEEAPKKTRGKAKEAPVEPEPVEPEPEEELEEEETVLWKDKDNNFIELTVEEFLELYELCYTTYFGHFWKEAALQEVLAQGRLTDVEANWAELVAAEEEE